MVLTHVYEIKENGWKHAEPDEIYNKFGKVSRAEHRLFCMLCSDYVTLVHGEKRGNFFRHGKDIVCDEKSDVNSPGKSFSIDVKKHDLPLRVIFDNSSKSFSFQLGILALPEQQLEKLEKENGIFSIKNDLGKCIGPSHSFERLNSQVTTYFNIGKTPYLYYKLTFGKNNYDTKLNDIIPRKVSGLSLTQINLFKKVSGKKIAEYGNVNLGEEYYVIYKSSNTILNLYSDNNVKFKNICRQGSWTLSTMSVIGISSKLIKFFLEQHYYLEEKTIDLTPVWPPYVENSEEIFLKNSINLFVNGEADVVYSMSNRITRPLFKEYESENGYLLSRMNPSFKNSVVAVGRKKVAKYLVLRSLKELEGEKQKLFKIEIADFKSNVLQDDVYSYLPEKDTLRITSEFDGKIDCYHNNLLEKSIALKAGKSNVLKHIRMNDELKIYQNLDCIKSISFKKNESLNSLDEDQKLLSFLKKCSGKQIFIHHDFAGIISQMADFPLSKQWVYASIRSGIISIKAYKELKNKFIY